jgi:hypothetical protein
MEHEQVHLDRHSASQAPAVLRGLVLLTMGGCEGWKGTISFVRPLVPEDPARHAVLAGANGGGWGDEDVLNPEAP